jgi:hypothetical protein
MLREVVMAGIFRVRSVEGPFAGILYGNLIVCPLGGVVGTPFRTASVLHVRLWSERRGGLLMALDFRGMCLDERDKRQLS